MRNKLLILLFTVCLTSCTSLRLPPTHSDFKKLSWNKRRTQLSKLNHWKIAGAFSVQYKNKSNLASYTWQQTNRHYQIQIQSSLNLFSLRLAGKPGRVTLWEASQKTIHANSAAALLQQRLGWKLPIEDLRYWIRGLPAPGAHQRRLDQFGHLVQLQQTGWNISLSHYASVKHFDLPRTLNIQGHGLKIRVVMKNWDLS